MAIASPSNITRWLIACDQAVLLTTQWAHLFLGRFPYAASAERVSTDGENHWVFVGLAAYRAVFIVQLLGRL